jgi:hypothetical protein
MGVPWKYFTEEDRKEAARRYAAQWRAKHPILAKKVRRESAKRRYAAYGYAKTKAWRLANPKRVREYRKQYNALRREKLHEVKRNLGCHDCGIKDPRVLDFHHRDPKQKHFTIGRKPNASRRKMRKEMAKCNVLCANCHRIVEYEKRRKK